VILRQTQSASYWTDSFVVENLDLEFLYNLLLEAESPLTTGELVQALIQSRVEREMRALQARSDGSTLYLPKDHYTTGQHLVFPALGYTAGVVMGVRPGENPEAGTFEVIEVDFGEGRPRREFAASLADHKLNAMPDAGGPDGTGEAMTVEQLAGEFGPAVAAKLEARLLAAGEVVRLAGAWFPKALLLDVHIGHLNVAEAVLDMAGGGPLPTEELCRHLELPGSASERLKIFSLNYALQEDNRFDEVGPTGKVLWFLRRLEPPEVLYPPRRLTVNNPPYDRAVLTDDLRVLAVELDDEFQPDDQPALTDDEVTITLTFPHRRVGTLPISHRVAHLFPTAQVSPRIQFTLVDGLTGDKLPAWVVREGRYVFGLDEWYTQNDVPPGGLIQLQGSDQPGEVIVSANKRKPAREWVRTVVPLENRLTFGMQKRLIGCEYDELMVVTFDNAEAVDEVWLRADNNHLPFDRLVAEAFRELAKLNPQSTVHAKTLYSAVNVTRRCTPEPIFAELTTRPYYIHVGDFYYRFDESRWSDAA
jgi:hypothetical protein